MYKSLQLQILKEEEKVLRDLEAKLKNQLTRLKVEELTLVNHMRSSEKEQTATTTSCEADHMETDSQPRLEDEEEQNLKPLLDLNVNNQLLMLMGEDEGEEEEEEEDDEDEEMVTEHDQLTSFMKQLENSPS